LANLPGQAIHQAAQLTDLIGHEEGAVRA